MRSFTCFLIEKSYIKIQNLPIIILFDCVKHEISKIITDKFNRSRSWNITRLNLQKFFCSRFILNPKLKTKSRCVYLFLRKVCKHDIYISGINVLLTCSKFNRVETCNSIAEKLLFSSKQFLQLNYFLVLSK